MLWRGRPPVLRRQEDEKVERLLSRAALEDGQSRAPDGLTDRVVAAAFADRAVPGPESVSGFDLTSLLLKPRIVGASLASFSAGAVLAVILMDMQASALLTSLMWGLARSVTAGGYL